MKTVNFGSVLFDLDGTLLDTAREITASLRFTFESHLGASPAAHSLVSGIGTPLREQLVHHGRNHLGQCPSESLLAEMAATFIAHNNGCHDETVSAFPGTLDALKALSSLGVRMGVVTSKPHELAMRGLLLTGLSHFFEVVIGADNVRFHKPHPEPVHKALVLLKAKPSRTLFVGDSPWDLWSGRGIGVATGAALWGPFCKADLAITSPTFFLQSISEIPPLC